VEDLDAFHAHALSRGARCLRPPQPEEFGRLAVYADPDGLSVSVAQMKAMESV
jgi:predicted enzyme related to lactoylglutathione lyase